MARIEQTDGSAFVAPSVAVLREHGGALDLREITRLTAERLHTSLMSEDVDAVLLREQGEGRVTLVTDTDDFRRRTWKTT